MGKSFKEKPWKYKNNKYFQKKQQQKKKGHGNKPHEYPNEDNLDDGSGGVVYSNHIN